MKEMIYKPKVEIEILDNGLYKGYKYVIVSFGTHLCTYVKLSQEHKYYGVKYDDIPITCHGGLTYSESYLAVIYDASGWWIGWDYAHGCDYVGCNHKVKRKKWTTIEIIEEIKLVIKQLEELK